MHTETFFGFLLTSYLILLLNGCAANEPNISTMPQKEKSTAIDPVITINAKTHQLAKYSKIAILPFVSLPSKPTSGEIVQGIACEIFSTVGFDVIERSQLSAILSEHKLTLSGALSDSTILNFGKLLGIKAIVHGVVTQFSYENQAGFTLRIMDVETAKVILSGSATFPTPSPDPPEVLFRKLFAHVILKWGVNPLLVELLQNPTPDRITRVKEELLINPDDYQLELALGWFNLEDGNLEEFKQHTMNAVSVADTTSPFDINIYINYGHTFLFSGDISTAERIYRRALKISGQKVMIDELKKDLKKIKSIYPNIATSIDNIYMSLFGYME